jgi:hypothetical protein
MMAPKTLADVILDGMASELDYMSPEDAAAALDRAAYLKTCDEDELADAADFIATAVTAPKGNR